MTDLSQRINELVNHFSGGNVSKFGARMGFSETNVRNYINGTLPKSEFLSKLVDVFEINATWLLQGSGPMLRPEFETVGVIEDTKLTYEMLKMKIEFLELQLKSDRDKYERMLEDKDRIISILINNINEKKG